METKWKPCPFCGSDKVGLYEYSGLVICDLCGSAAKREKWNYRAELKESAGLSDEEVWLRAYCAAASNAVSFSSSCPKVADCMLAEFRKRFRKSKGNDA